MFDILFVTALFSPIFARIVVGLVPGKSGTAKLVVLTFSLTLIAGLFLTLGWRMGVYGAFIPYCLVAFWLPQLALIAFFELCEREETKDSF